MRQYTAAHPTMPFQTHVKVTNLSNNKFIIVRINDRGPHTKKRIIDLSKAAAQKLDMIQTGCTKVKIEEVSKEEAISVSTPNFYKQKRSGKSKGALSSREYKVGSSYNNKGEQIKLTGFGIQLNVFQDRQKAHRFVKELTKKNYLNVYIQVFSHNKEVNYKIIVGKYASRKEAAVVLEQLKNDGFKGFVRKNRKRQ
jgi:rare lipoprotein A